MSRADVMDSTLDEIQAIFNAYDEAGREAWERTRLLATVSLQPYSRGRLTPEEVLKFPWDEPTPSNNTEPDDMTIEERRALVKRLTQHL